MDSELEQLVRAGKLPADFAERLDRFSPGNYVLHRQWGVGKVCTWSLSRQEIQLLHENGQTSTMGLKLAYKELTPLPQGHFLTLLHANPQAFRQKAKNVAERLPFLVSLLRGNLALHGNALAAQPMAPAELRQQLVAHGFIPAAGWHLWWSDTCAALSQCSDGLRITMNEQGEITSLQALDSAADELLSAYANTPDLAERVALLQQANLERLKASNRKTLGRLILDMERTLAAPDLPPAYALALIVLRDRFLGLFPQPAQLRSRILETGRVSLLSPFQYLRLLTVRFRKEHPEAYEQTYREMEERREQRLAQFLRDNNTQRAQRDEAHYSFICAAPLLASCLAPLPAQTQVQFCRELRQCLPEDWLGVLVCIFLCGEEATFEPILRFINAQKCQNTFFYTLVNSLDPDILIQSCQELCEKVQPTVLEQRSPQQLLDALSYARERCGQKPGSTFADRLFYAFENHGTLATCFPNRLSAEDSRCLTQKLATNDLLYKLLPLDGS